MAGGPAPLPCVSIVVPSRNEAKHLAACLGALVAQDYPSERIEILVVDGVSRDGTPEIVADFAKRFAQIRLLRNPRGITPVALNIGIRAARGEIVVRVDGHCVVAPDYVRQCVHRLMHTDASNVGGAMRAMGNGYVGTAIALATSSPFGVGNARFHYSNDEGYVDTVYLGAYRRSVFELIGGFDEELVRNQDDELNYRLRAAGGKILLSPAIKSCYFGRQRLRDLFRQYYQYGYWKVRVAAKHPRSLLPRHLVPGCFVLLSAIVALAALVNRPWASAFVALAAVYVLSAFGFALRATPRGQYSVVPVVVAAYVCLHFGYGLGFLAAVVRQAIWRRRRTSKCGCAKRETAERE